MSTRAEKVAEAQRLRAQGFKLREIGEWMGGFAVSTVHGWLSDPDLSKQRALRDERYRGVCGCCGGPTNGSNGYKAPTVCQECLTWSEDAILDAMRRWAEEHGMPPRGDDWRHAAPEHPCSVTVSDRFGWNEMLLRAGFKLRTDRRPETQEWIEKQIRAGVPVQDIADRLGVTYAAITQRLYTRGLSITALRNGAAA